MTKTCRQERNEDRLDDETKQVYRRRDEVKREDGVKRRFFFIFLNYFISYHIKDTTINKSTFYLSHFVNISSLFLKEHNLSL